MENIDISPAIQTLSEYAALYIPKLLLAIFTLIIGLWIINLVVKSIRKALTKRQVDPSLVPFLSSLIKALLVVILLISVAGQLGVAIASFVAVLGAAGLAIGLALQGSLSNFAGGILILILKPFKVGDVIEAQGDTASVSEIQIFYTILKSYDNKTIVIPNGSLSNDKIINYSTEPTRTVEWVFGISYNDDIDKARQIIKDTVFADERVQNRDTPFINLAELADSSVNFKVRAQCEQANFWALFFEKTEAVKKAFDANGISIPYPQVDAHLYQASPGQ
ncbi:MAG: mechanosensitive ion channel domain-containing protein [Tunicatimonas sp.]|uniref:mechanosensitive ion channel family protein n=1 Tax=Tunicatimonas sp. TaxID=1940096 RepID=UPI003C73C75E